MGPVTGTKIAEINYKTEPLLQLGDAGPAVSDLQQLLNVQGAGLAVDGDWGPKTDAAVRDFQKQHGLAVDGIAGPKTMAALRGAEGHRSAPGAHAHGNSRRLDLQQQLSGPDSQLSIAIGVAEGTRTPDGARTPAYDGHKDPVSGYNVGTFSYQHKASSPAQADALQLEDFRRVQPEYENACRKANLDPANPLLAATFFDLYNQAPKAAMDKGGFLDQLPSLAKKGITPDNLAQARYASFYDPDKGAFDTKMSLTDLKADQKRRTDCLVQVMGRGEATAPPAGKIGLGSEGPGVAELKQALKEAGFYTGPVNEQMGQQGIDALERAKAALHIGGPIDVAGPETLKRIQDYAKSGTELHVPVDFVSQFDGRVEGDYPTQSAKLKCDNACEYMMSHTGNPANRVAAGKGDASIRAYHQGGMDDAQVKYLKDQLLVGKPVMIGVAHDRGTKGTGNPNGINHYLVATGMGVDEKGRQYITFNDPVQTSAERGKDTNPENRLYLTNGEFVQNRTSDPYQLRGVVVNRG